MTEKQKRVLQFICDFIAENKFSPSFESIMLGENIRSKSEVHGIFAALKNKKLIKFKFNIPRSVELTRRGLVKLGGKFCPCCGGTLKNVKGN